MLRTNTRVYTNYTYSRDLEYTTRVALNNSDGYIAMVRSGTYICVVSTAAPGEGGKANFYIGVYVMACL